MLKRKALQKMEEWKQNKTCQGLLVMGARQVGKTTTIREFSETHYKCVIEINFYENPQAKETLAQAENASDLLLRITTLARTRIIEGETIIFLDEIQECPNLLTLTKFLLENSNFDLIMSGSLLGLDAFPARSLPVGYLQLLTMYPCDFEEYCWARSIPLEAIKEARNCFVSRKKMPDYLHNLFLQEFYYYLLSGGMPNALQTFIDTNSLQATQNAQRNLVDLYEYDITKYINDKTNARQIEMIYESIPKQLNKENKRFAYTRLDKNVRFANLETAFDWLRTSGISLICEKVGEPIFPLKASVQISRLKAYYNDVGLLVSQLMPGIDIDILNRKASMNYGSIFENVAAQELFAHGFDLYYYNGNKTGEIDFILENNAGDIKLCEIKSGKDYKRHSALNKLLATKNYEFSDVFVFYDGNVEQKGAVTYLPIYMIDFLHYKE